MAIRIGVENNNDDRSIAWALEHPGCFAYGGNADQAISNLKPALEKYADWMKAHNPKPWFSAAPADLDFMVDGTWEVYYINADLEKVADPSANSVESFFPFDWKPLSAVEIEHALQLLAWSRLDLLGAVDGLSPEKLDATYPGERWSINGILNHVGGAEWWYLDRLGLAFPRDEVPKQPRERLEKVRAHFNALLPGLKGVRQVVGVDGEFWSPRKLLRRASWHERDHVDHIRKLL